MAFLEFIRGTASSVAAAFAETEVATPASRTESMAMLIWHVEFDSTPPNMQDNVISSVVMHLAESTQTGELQLEDDDLIVKDVQRTDTGTAQGSLTEYTLIYGNAFRPRTYNFDPPILYPRASVFFGIIGINTALTKIGRFRIGYTLEKVSAQDFIAALVD